MERVDRYVDGRRKDRRKSPEGKSLARSPFYMLSRFSSSHIPRRVLAPLLRFYDHSAAGSLYARGRPERHRLNPWLHLQRGLRKREIYKSCVLNYSGLHKMMQGQRANCAIAILIVSGSGFLVSHRADSAVLSSSFTTWLDEKRQKEKRGKEGSGGAQDRQGGRRGRW